MWPTAEVRWFFEGPLPPEVASWFIQLGRHFQEQPRREDYYLRQTGGGCLGMKLREGRLEIKERCRQLGGVCFHERVNGTVEYWRKWTFPLAAGDGGAFEASSIKWLWLRVGKQRNLRLFVPSERRRVCDAIPQAETTNGGCHLELTRIDVENSPWWTLAFEAFGDESTNHERLLAAANHVLATLAPPSLPLEPSYGYPHWLDLLASGR